MSIIAVAMVLKEQAAGAGLGHVQLLVVLLVDGVAARAAAHWRIAAAVRVRVRPVHAGGHGQVFRFRLLGQVDGDPG